uniref:Uncharacterized protein n=1 Tax=Ananas comosus var. bracteatus TaxID=296719 RepID=A0A6V7NHE4_ANACO|nr:unnamed protein product [Ananas comosus var. bracteatus]
MKPNPPTSTKASDSHDEGVHHTPSTLEDAPNQAQNQVGLKLGPPQSFNRKLEATKVRKWEEGDAPRPPKPLKKTTLHTARSGQFSPRGTGLSPAGTGLSLRIRKTNVREPVSPCAEPVSPQQGPVSAARDRLPRRLRSTVHKGTGLSFQGPVPESKNSQDSAKTLEIELLGRYTINDPPPSVEKFGMQIEHSNLAICKDLELNLVEAAIAVRIESWLKLMPRESS